MNIDHFIRTMDHIGDNITNPKGWIVLTTFFWFINQYIFSQWNFALGFIMIFFIDTIIGSFVAWRLKEFSAQKFRKMLFDKSVIYFGIIISYSIATKITLEDGTSLQLIYLDVAIYGLLTTVEISSIAKNIYRYKKWPWLKYIMKHYEGFSDETGKPKANETDK